MHKSAILATAIALLALMAGCSSEPETTKRSAATDDLKPGLDSITASEVMDHTMVLSSDEFEGRAPGTKGEELTVQYLVSRFRDMGLKPGNPDGSYIQKVPLVGITGEPQGAFVSGRSKLELRFPENSVAVSRHARPEVTVRNSEMVFVGYGVVAPEFGWDDYKGVDVKGKTLVMLVNDPAVPDPNDPSKLDEGLFKGKAMTYYGRWTYKYEIASEKGAAAAVIIHETGPAGYPWEVVAGSWSHENFDIKVPGPGSDRILVESWISTDCAQKLFQMTGRKFEDLKKAALDRNFKPIELGVHAEYTIRNQSREIESTNVVALLEGSDPELKGEYVIYTSHWDHLGKNQSLQGDQVYNGALDNASGTAGLLELSGAFTKLSRPPKRSVLFLAVTAEEQGLLGAKYYAANPLYPLEKTAANINMDGANTWGRTRDVVVIGRGNSTLDDVLESAAEFQGRVLKADPEPEKGFFYRSDHFEFAKQGVPALYTDTGTEFVGKSPEFSQQKRDEYTQRDYHKVTDEIKPDWDLSGAVEDLQLLMMAGYRIAEQVSLPEWRPGTEFKAKREEMLKKK
jgi:Zn-dependent M28 family amino/carboxypeptidase